MKSHVIALVGLLLGSALGLHAESYSFKEPISASSPFKPNGVLSLENVNGPVEVLAWDKNEISITGEKSAKTEEELKQIDLKMDVTDAHATIKVRLPKRGGLFGGDTIHASVRFTIHVPSDVAIDHIEIVNSTITLDRLHGPIHAESVNGRIEGTDLSGDAHLKTVNGSITAQFKSIAANQHLSFDTVNGAITVRLPSDAGATIDGNVVNGRIVTDFPFTSEGTIRSHRLKGTIGDGRARIEAHTVNGGIKIQKI